MSMNLCFRTRVGNYHIPFPIQTPTELTYSVLENKDNLEKQLQLIKETLEKWDCLECYSKIESMMKDKNLILEMM